jgi:hypothetical protein
MRYGLRTTLAMVAGLSSLACDDKPSEPTAVMVRMNADPEVKRGMRALALRISRQREGSWEGVIERAWEIDSRFTWPAELPIAPAQDTELRTFEVVVEARASDGHLIAGTRAVTTFEQDEVTALGVFLQAACMERGDECETPSSGECPGAEPECKPCRGPDCMTCRAGRCVRTGISTLPPYDESGDVGELFDDLTEDTK